MGRVSRDGASERVEGEGFEGRYEEVEGYMVGFERYSADADLAPLFAGLPDDRCQCPHFGVVLRGKVGFRYADGLEEIGEGEAYVTRPGHTPVIHAGTELIEFSPIEQFQQTMEVVARNLEQAEA